MQIMITNGGAHPADKWAETTTETLLALIVVNESSVTPEAAAARAGKRNLRPALFEILVAHHGAVQDHERGQCKNAKHASSDRFDPTEHVDEAMVEIDEAFAGSPFAEHFGKPEVREIVRRIVAQHFVNSMNIERLIAQDKAGA